MDVQQRIIKILSQQVNLEEYLIKLSTKFTDLGMDSLVVLEFVIVVEEEFDITLDEIEIHNLNNVAELVDFVERKLG
ncbi:MAG: acyl carrier protein [Bacillota bacterium]